MAIDVIGLDWIGQDYYIYKGLSYTEYGERAERGSPYYVSVYP